jgi:transposase-like protein
MMRAVYRRPPFSLSVDKNAAYRVAFSSSQDECVVTEDCKLRRVKYVDKVSERDHRFVRKKVRSSQCSRAFRRRSELWKALKV